MFERDIGAAVDHEADLIADLAENGNGAVALAGSRGKGRSDDQLDYDFRVYADAYRGPDGKADRAMEPVRNRHA